MKLLLGLIIILTTSCTEIFKTQLPPIQDCTDDTENCSYTQTIQPIFDMYCTKCHGNQGGLDLTSFSGLMIGGISGEVIDNANFSNSILLERLTNSTNPMPPSYDGGMIDDIYINMISKWIQAGAKNN